MDNLMKWRFIRYVAACAVFCFLAAGVADGQNVPDEKEYFLHTVERGQTLTSIAKMYNVKIADIVKLNPDSENHIFAGSELKIPQSRKVDESERFHTIQPGETLYKLSIMYDVTTTEICNANPGLSAYNFKVGEVIRIPAAEKKTQQPPVKAEEEKDVNIVIRTNHEVKRRETIYSICRKYGITEEELLAVNPELTKGLKRGSIITIPYHVEEKKAEEKEQQMAEPELTDEEIFSSNRPEKGHYDELNIAVILPFSSTGKEKSRMVEFYEGFLIAVNEMKENGASMNIHTYDSGTSDEKISSILALEEMKKMNVIFGPGQKGSIKTLSDFSKKNRITLVVPFSFSNDEIFDNPYMFQINTPQSYLYSEVYENFIKKFKNYNILFVSNDSKGNDKADFIKGLKAELSHKKIGYSDIKVSSDEESIKRKISATKENLFVPADGKALILNMLLPKLTVMAVNDSITNMHLFGYPEWQTYTGEFLSSFYELDTYFYTSFYTNSIFPEALQYSNLYHRWYGRDMANSYPKYGMLGYDIGLFFLKGLWQYGNSFADHVNKVSVNPVQTGFRFERVNNWGGFINKKVFFIHFTRDYKLEKLDF